MKKAGLLKTILDNDTTVATKSAIQLMKARLAEANQDRPILPFMVTSNDLNKPLTANKTEAFPTKHKKKETKPLSIMRLNFKKKDEILKKHAYAPLISRKKSEFDNIVKDWSTTNWLNSTPVIQQKPCHILVHDKLLYENLNLFETVHSIVIRSVPEIDVSYEDLQQSFEMEISTMLLGNVGPMSNLMIERSLRKIIKNVYSPYAQGNKEATYKLNKCVKDTFLIRKIFTMLNSNVIFNEAMFSKLKTIENLNRRNDISIIKDNELTLIPSFDYRSLINRINKRMENPIKQMTILQYKSILGHKINDFQNLQIMKNLLISEKLHCNERFIIITAERSTSLEYFRLLKLFNKTYSDLKLKGCVVYMDLESATKTRLIPLKKEKTYTGKECYYVVEEFSEIYDIIEVL